VADESIDILIPVLNRPQNVQRVMDSIAEVTETPHQVIFIATEGDRDEIKALKKAKATFYVHPEPAGRANFAKKINWVFPKTTAPWIFQAADDLRFHWGWDTFALRFAEQRNAAVIGTNDLGNKLVMRGGHSTHTFFRRSYIEEYGGTYDDTGLVFCELYDHQYTDNEFVQTAIRRGQWAFCKRSLVEHLHPVWRKGEFDETYEKAFRETQEDNRLYMRRMRQGDQRERRARLLEQRRLRDERRRRR
jgi:glycosyltransferase involved in cell wall biosynthesis